MPNHIINVITAPKHVIDALINDEGQVDFSRTIPEPENLERGGCDMRAVGGIHLDTREVCWYEWNTRNWGTKWNAYSTDRISDTEVKFETAWSHPEKIIEALTEKFPTETIEVKYADEDLGYNFGHYTVNGPSILEEHETPESGTNEAVLWAYRLKYKADATMEDLRDEGYIDDEDED